MSINDSWVVVVHGGAGDVLDAADHPAIEAAVGVALERALAETHTSGDAMAVAVAAVSELERCEYFDAGFGGYPRLDGRVQLDVSLVDGSGKFIAFAGIHRLIHPSRLAYALYQREERSMFRWFDTHLFPEIGSLIDANKEYFGVVDTDEQMIAPYALQSLDVSRSKRSVLEHGTVGCVVRDPSGRVVAVTSTGGTAFAPFGRVGDSPIVGAGSFADNDIGALSATGHGESFMSSATTAFAACRLQRDGSSSISEILESELLRMSNRNPGRSGGLIAVTKDGRAATTCLTPIMPAGIARLNRSDSEIKVSIFGRLELV